MAIRAAPVIIVDASRRPRTLVLFKAMSLRNASASWRAGARHTGCKLSRVYSPPVAVLKADVVPTG
jgi:hypothetical protein